MIDLPSGVGYRGRRKFSDLVTLIRGPASSRPMRGFFCPLVDLPKKPAAENAS